MIIDNKIEKIFNEQAVFAAYIFLIAGIFLFLLNFFSSGSILIGSIFIISALFVIFSSSGVEINTEKRLVKQYNKLFGVIKLGKWHELDSFKGLTLIPIKKVYGMASWSNRKTSLVKKDFRIFLVNNKKRPAFPLKTCKTMEQAQNSVDEFSIWLKMPVYSAKR